MTTETTTPVAAAAPVAAQAQAEIKKKKKKVVKSPEEVVEKTAADTAKAAAAEAKEEATLEAAKQLQELIKEKCCDVEKLLVALLEKKSTESRKNREEVQLLKHTLKVYQKEQRDSQKVKRRRERPANAAPRDPNGFAKACAVSDQLCDFLGEAHGTPFARTAVTKRIIAYVKEHTLENPANRRIIFPDEHLTALLGEPIHPVKEGENGYSYFNLQRYLNKHFFKAKKDEVAAAAPAPASA